MDILSNFGEVLQELINERGISLRKLNKETEIATSTLSLYTRGISSPTIKNVIILAKHFDCSIEYLFGRTLQRGHCAGEQSATFFERVDNLRKEAKLKKRELARLCGFSHPRYYSWEKGENPLIENVIALADFFCVTTDYLLGLTDKK